VLAKRLRASLPDVVERVRKGTRFTLFFQYRDKNFSFTDCASFIVMRETRLTHALTTDTHFRQAGFQVLPRSRGRSNK
jgi:predicted nucleic acid-binding protein